MNKNLFKSIGAFIAGLVATFVLSYATDAVLEATGLMSSGVLPMYGSELLIVTVLIYRNIYNVVGSYIAARLAPNHPMGHALALGTFGFVMMILVTIATWDLALGPAWYSVALIVFAFPTAWLGGKLYETRSQQLVTRES
ncbi:MAG: hypothetical protein HZB51_33775 [Chloroflexi bacterium]|nr:hypothetical protein [Chloroflexota bacterium]